MVAPFGRRRPGALPLRILRRRIHRLKTRVRVRQLRKADTDNPPLQQKVYSRAEKCATTVWPNMVWRGALSTRGICKSGRYPAEIHGLPDDSRAKSGRIVLFRQSPRGSGSSGLAVPIVVDARGERFLMDEGRGKSRRAQTPLPAARRTVGRIAVSRGPWVLATPGRRRRSERYATTRRGTGNPADAARCGARSARPRYRVEQPLAQGAHLGTRALSNSGTQAKLLPRHVGSSGEPA
ncbi:MAG: hypothetical protein JWO52_1277 [Gammaproteobacteria bacterium]|nr:hypothetical protein [Gammaproteobacteria bacterium]